MSLSDLPKEWELSSKVGRTHDQNVSPGPSTP